MILETNQLINIEKLKERGDLPAHVAIIMDGNGRWAQKRGMLRTVGHKHGAKQVQPIVESCAKLGIKVLSLFAFSSENWGRSKLEVSILMNLLDSYLIDELKNLKKAGVRLRIVGELDRLPSKTRQAIENAQFELKDEEGLILNVAISYGSRNEIVSAVKNIAQKVNAGELKVNDISEYIINSNLWTAGMPDPDLLIRTSGEMRLSNFFLWQLAYTELFFTSISWPDFTVEHFFEAVSSFQSRKRRFGLAK